VKHTYTFEKGQFYQKSIINDDFLRTWKWKRQLFKSMFYIKRIPLNKIPYKHDTLLMLLFKIRICIIFVILLVSLKNISLVCYNMKIKKKPIILTKIKIS